MLPEDAADGIRKRIPDIPAHQKPNQPTVTQKCFIPESEKSVRTVNIPHTGCQLTHRGTTGAPPSLAVHDLENAAFRPCASRAGHNRRSAPPRRRSRGNTRDTGRQRGGDRRRVPNHRHAEYLSDFPRLGGCPTGQSGANVLRYQPSRQTGRRRQAHDPGVGRALNSPR